jgi:hypothetical protein
MKQGDVYLRKEDNRLYAVAMLDVCLTSGWDRGEKIVIMRPLKKLDNEPAYYAEYEYKFENYEFQYNLYDGIPKEDVEG